MSCSWQTRGNIHSTLPLSPGLAAASPCDLWLRVPTEGPAPGRVGSVDSGAGRPGFELPLRDLGKSHDWSGLSALTAGVGGGLPGGV